MKKILFLLLLSMNIHAQEKLLDKIVAVINTRVVSLSELDRMEETLHARRELSPLVFTEAKYDKKQLLQTVIQSLTPKNLNVCSDYGFMRSAESIVESCR
jgi:peptidyl-prolyl cis-trans isomerase SurA